MTDLSSFMGGNGASLDALSQKLLSMLPSVPKARSVMPEQRQLQDVIKQQQALTPPAPPQLQQIPQNVPKAQFTSAFNDMTMPMMLMATLAGGMTANPMASAFNNGASFMKGLHEGDTEATKNAYNEFNTKLNAAKAQNQSTIDQYKMALDKYGNDAQKLKDIGSSIAAASNNEHLQSLFDNGQFEEAFKVVDSLSRLQEQMQEHQDQIQMLVQRSGKNAAIVKKDGTITDGWYNPYTGFSDINGKPIPQDQVANYYPGIPAEGIVTPATANRAAEQAWAGDYHDAIASASGFGNVGNINRGMIANAITQYGVDHGKTGADIAAKIAQFHGQMAAATTAGHIIGSTEQGAQEIQQFVPVIQNLSQQIDRTRFPTLNSIELAARKGTGDPAVVAFNSYIQSAKNAYALVMTRGGRTTDAARSRADELLSPNMSVDQVATALHAMSLEASVAQSSALRATQQVTGQDVTAPISPGAAAAQTPSTMKWDDLK